MIWLGFGALAVVVVLWAMVLRENRRLRGNNGELRAQLAASRRRAVPVEALQFDLEIVEEGSD